MRIIFDEQGDGHNDLIIKMDNQPPFITIADSYYLPDFMGIKEGDLKKKEGVVIDYLNYIIQAFSEDQNEYFIPYGFYDEGIEGLHLSKHKMGLRINLARTTKYTGYSLTKNLLNNLSIHSLGLSIDHSTEWIRPVNHLKQELQQSIDRIILVCGNQTS